MGLAQKKKNSEVDDWMKDAIPLDEDASDEWMNDAIPLGNDHGFASPDQSRLNVNLTVPTALRVQVGALHTPEDRLRTVRKRYPNAEPYGDDNFIMTDPETGDSLLYNPEGFDWGDWASIVPETAEAIGAGVGGVIGGAGGAAGGSVVPGVGTVAGGVGGAMVGAGTGGTIARDGTERLLNWWFDNDDTRGTGEYLQDKAADFGLNAVGEGVGMAAAKGGSAAYRAGRNWFAGGSKAKAGEGVQQLAKDFTEANVPTTVGTVTGDRKQLGREATLRNNESPRMWDAEDAANEAVQREYDRIADTISPSASTRQGAGESIIEGAKGEREAINENVGDLYRNVDDTIGGNAIKGDNTTTLNKTLKTEKKALSNTEVLTKGSQIDEAIKHTDAITKDLKQGMSFREMQEARTELGRLAFSGDTNPALAVYYRRAYEAVTKDMEDAARSMGDEAFNAWKQADEAYKGRFGPEGSDRILSPLANAKSGEEAYRRLVTGLKDGGTNLQRTRELIERSSDPELWGSVTRRYIDELGTNTVADGSTSFSGRKFLQGWNKLSPEAKDAMFKGTQFSQVRQDLDRLARITEARQRAASARGVKPNTTTNMILGWGSLGTYTGGKAVNDSFRGRLATDPRIVRWFADLPQAQTNGGLNDHFNALRQIGRELDKEYGSEWASGELNEFLNSHLKDEENRR